MPGAIFASLLGFACLLLPLAAQEKKPQRPKFKLGPDSVRQEGVPRGMVTQRDWRSEILKGTLRQWYLYVPAQYDGRRSAAVMVFQDGHAYVREDGDIRVPIVFDNLIHRGEMPVTIGIFLNPGLFAEKIEGQQGRKAPPGVQSNRSVEYDALSPAYASFLEEEILAEVAKNYRLTDNPELRAICGMSSGGICAFTAAWQRPDLFRKVVSHIGSFTNIRGGHVYPALIRKTKSKPLRIFLQDGSNDLDNAHGNWWLGNLQMEKALQFKKYDHRTVWGQGGHSGKHGGSIFPDTMRWLWRDWQKG
ncbi:MAG: esterase [Verrucomicrobiaceae bacterium]|nr:esterase [Verrucomicrobiaceae bacterium]